MNGDTEALRSSDSALAWSRARQGWSKVLPGDGDAVLGTGTRNQEPHLLPHLLPSLRLGGSGSLSTDLGSSYAAAAGSECGAGQGFSSCFFLYFYSCPSSGEDDPGHKVRGREAQEAVTREQPHVLRAELGEAMAVLLGLGFSGDSPGPSKGMPTLSGSAQPRPGQVGATAQTRFRGLWPLGDGVGNFGGFFPGTPS